MTGHRSLVGAIGITQTPANRMSSLLTPSTSFRFQPFDPFRPFDPVRPFDPFRPFHPFRPFCRTSVASKERVVGHMPMAQLIREVAANGRPAAGPDSIAAWNQRWGRNDPEWQRSVGLFQPTAL